MLIGWILAPFRTLIAIVHTAICCVIGLLAMALNKGNGSWVMWNLGRNMWSVPLIQWVLGAKLEVEVHPAAQELADSQQGVVLVANHCSLLDINAAFAGSPTPIVFLSKASIRKVPLLGKLNELAGTVFVERGNRASSEVAVKQLTQTLLNGRSVLVFPEDTQRRRPAPTVQKRGISPCQSSQRTRGPHAHRRDLGTPWPWALVDCARALFNPCQGGRTDQARQFRWPN